MGFEDEVEQSSGGLAVRRMQVQATERTHLIHRPARDIIPPLGGARGSPIVIDPAQPSCRYDLPGPAELGAVNPYAVHDHGQPTCQRHDRLFHPALSGDLIAQALSQDHLLVAG